MATDRVNSPRRTFGRSVVGVLVLLLLASSTVVISPTSASAASPGGACPSAAVPATSYTDTVRSTHRAAIDCLTWWGLTSGRTPTVYGGADRITRGQTAAMVARLLERTGNVPANVPAAGFTDTVGHRFSDEIDLLAHLDIVRGTTATTFDPAGSTTRAQMASIVVRTLERGYGLSLPVGTVPFTDVPRDNTHREAIGKLVAAGITTGTSATTFHPGRTVTRAQMASFLTRSTSLLVDRGLATLPTRRPAANDPFASATRGTWVHLFDDTLKSRSSIRRMVDELAAAEVNTVIVQVARRHDAYYRSEVLPATLDPRLASGLDVLEELLPLAHARGIEVHAWFGVAPHWHGVYESLGIRPSQLGADVAWRTRTRSGTTTTYLDPGLLAVQQHVADVVGELAANYDVDGIHLDYVRYESNEHGYHPDALARFRRETGATGTPAPTNTQWSNWRRAQTQQIVVRARQAVRAANPDIELSAATISWMDGPATSDRAGFMATRSYRDVLQDWDGWARTSRLETVIPMNYFRDHDAAQAAGFQRWLRYERQLSRDTTVAVVPGVAGYLNRPAAGARQVEDAMRFGDGAVVYSYQQPTDDGSRDIWNELAQTRWRYPPIAR
jgi:uncharacterized lipoprotein YddW (UPF0748 family)